MYKRQDLEDGTYDVLLRAENDSGVLKEYRTKLYLCRGIRKVMPRKEAGLLLRAEERARIVRIGDRVCLQVGPSGLEGAK